MKTAKHYTVTLLLLSLLACSEDQTKKKKDGDGGELKASHLQTKVIYGSDDRLDMYEVAQSEIYTLALSTAALVFNSDLRQEGDTTHLHTQPYVSSYRLPLCEGERFRDQDTLAYCSGFLVSPSVMVTAGHCVQTQGSPSSDCENTSFVFGFSLFENSARPQSVRSNDVYKCKRVIKNVLTSGGADFAVIELDRPVTDRAPLALRRNGVLPVGSELFVVGHPSGLPTKIAGGAHVRAQRTGFFVASLDTYGGNSGSAVFNAQTGEVEGILVRGEADFVSRGNCMASKECTQDGCRGEDVTKISEVLPYLPN